MTRPGGAATPIWAVLAIIAAAIVAHASYTADLSAFLPRSPTATQQLLIEQLRSGPAARLLLLAIEGGSGAERSQVSAELAAGVRAPPTPGSARRRCEPTLRSSPSTTATPRASSGDR